MPKFLSVKEVAGLLGTSVKWVYAHQRLLPGRIKIAGLIRFDRERLLKELASRPEKRPRLF
jgi:predicted DNA-binding transcriptional regulator AlpA